MSSPNAEDPSPVQEVPRYALIPIQTTLQDAPPRREPFVLKRRIASKWFIALHAGISLFYVVLCVLYGCRVEKRIIVPLTHASWYQNGMNQILHGTFIVYLAILAAAMKPLITSFSRPRDSRRDRRCGARWHLVVFAAYSVMLAGLKVTTSSLISIPTVNITSYRNDVTTILGVPPIDALLPPGVSEIPSDFSDISFDWYRATLLSGTSFSDVNGSLLNNPGTIPGVFGNRVFDIITDAGSYSGQSGTASVGYTDFNVTCGSVPQVSLSATAPGGPLNTSSGDPQLHTLLSINYTLDSQPMLLSDSMSISLSNGSDKVSQLWQPSNVSVRIPSSPLVPGIGRNLILYNIYDETAVSGGYGSQAIEDANGSVGSPWPLEVQRTGGLSPFRTGLMIQVIGCSLFTRSGRGTFDLSTGTLSADNAMTAPESNAWAAWQPDMTRSNSIQDAWASMFLSNNTAPLWYNQPIPPDVQWSCIDFFPIMNGNNTDCIHAWNISTLQSMYASCHAPTIMEDWLTSWIFPNPVAFSPENLWTPQLTDLEDALGSATASSVYNAALGGKLTTYTYNTSSVGASEQESSRLSTRVVLPTYGNTTVASSILVARVTFNPVSLLGGTVFAVALTAIVACMVAVTEQLQQDNVPSVQDLGSLSLAAADNYEVTSYLARARANGQDGDLCVKIVKI